MGNCGEPRELADCCVAKDNPTGKGKDTPCDGEAPNVWGCCTGGDNGKRCGEDEGDCDSNDDCMPGLECQADSCPGDKFGGVFPAGQVDCCKKTSSWWILFQLC